MNINFTRVGRRAVVLVVALLVPMTGRAAVDAPFWTAAARVVSGRATRLAGEAGALVAGDRLAEAEGRLRAAVALGSDEPGLSIALAEVQAILGHDAAAVASIERVLARGGTGGGAGEEAALWSRLGALRAKLGRYGGAAAAYGAAVAAGASSADLYANLGEVLMAEGRLSEAEARYRDAIAAATSEITGERRPRSQDLALAYYGLGVALDRREQPIAAREMISRALAQDPGGALLKVAAASHGDLFFVPDGDVYYYLGLVAEAEGHAIDAEAAFREFLARLPESRWARTASAHVGKTVSAAGAAAPGPAARIVAVGTVQASGGIAAPLIDAAWRGQLGLLDDCLGRAHGQGSVRFVLELELDGQGQVTRVTAKAPPPFDEGFARCAESAIKQHLRVSAPARAKPTLARTEVIVAFP